MQHTCLHSSSRQRLQTSSTRPSAVALSPRPLCSAPNHHHQRHSSRLAAVSTRTVVTTTTTQQQETQQQQEASWGWGSLFGGGRKKQQAPTLQTISEAELWQMLEVEQEVPLVVIFSAHWCGPCKIMVQRLESLMKTLGPQGIKAVKIDTDECPELASQLQVHKLPTLYFVGSHPSNPPAHFTGLLPEHVMRDMLENKSKFLGTDLRRAVSC